MWKELLNFAGASKITSCLENCFCSFLAFRLRQFLVIGIIVCDYLFIIMKLLKRRVLGSFCYEE